MSKFIPLSKEQILKGIVAPFVKVLSYAFSLIPDKALVAEIIGEVQTAVAEIKVGDEAPTQEEAVRALLDVAETASNTTETQVDDTLVDAAKVGADFVYKRGAGVISFFKLLALRAKAKKEAKAEASGQ